MLDKKRGVGGEASWRRRDWQETCVATRACTSYLKPAHIVMVLLRRSHVNATGDWKCELNEILEAFVVDTHQYNRCVDVVSAVTSCLAGSRIWFERCTAHIYIYLVSADSAIPTQIQTLPTMFNPRQSSRVQRTRTKRVRLPSAKENKCLAALLLAKRRTRKYEELQKMEQSRVSKLASSVRVSHH
jgi:hypothetical protein